MNTLNQTAVTTADHVDLFDLLHVIFSGWKAILSAASIFCAFSIVYVLFFAEPFYKADAILKPSEINQLDAINRSGVYSLSPEEALRNVGLSLASYDLRLRFYNQNPSLFRARPDDQDSRDREFEKFNRDWLSVVMPTSSDTAGRVSVVISYPKGVEGPDILNGLVKYAIADELEKVRTNISVIVKNRLSEIESQLNAARIVYEYDKKTKIASLLERDRLKRDLLLDELKGLRLQLKTQRTDRIAQLSESIAIAGTLGIKRPATPSSFGEVDRSGSNVVRTEINNQAIPLYFMGTDALEAERDALLKRTSDDFAAGRVAEINKELLMLSTNREVEVLNGRQQEDLFLQGVEPLRKEIVRLNGLNLSLQGVALVTVDQSAIQPKSPFKPKPLLIISLGVLLGVVAGSLWLLLRHYLRAQRSLRMVRLPSPTVGSISGDGPPISIA